MVWVVRVVIVVRRHQVGAVEKIRRWSDVGGLDVITTRPLTHYNAPIPLSHHPIGLAPLLPVGGVSHLSIAVLNQQAWLTHWLNSGNPDAGTKEHTSNARQRDPSSTNRKDDRRLQAIAKHTPILLLESLVEQLHSASRTVLSHQRLHYVRLLLSCRCYFPPRPTRRPGIPQTVPRTPIPLRLG